LLGLSRGDGGDEGCVFVSLEEWHRGVFAYDSAAAVTLVGSGVVCLLDPNEESDASCALYFDAYLVGRTKVVLAPGVDRLGMRFDYLVGPEMLSG